MENKALILLEAWQVLSMTMQSSGKTQCSYLGTLLPSRVVLGLMLTLSEERKRETSKSAEKILSETTAWMNYRNGGSCQAAAPDVLLKNTLHRE